MTRADVQQAVMKHLVRIIDGLEDVEIDATRSMKDYGANSLDIVEIVSSVMRELKIKVPRARLATISNLDGLVDVLWETAESAAQPASPV